MEKELVEKMKQLRKKVLIGSDGRQIFKTDNRTRQKAVIRRSENNRMKEANGALEDNFEVKQRVDEGIVQPRKRPKGYLPFWKSAKVFVGAVLIIGLALSFFFAVRPIESETFTEVEIEWSNNSADYEEVATNITLADLKLSIIRRFKHPTCDGKRNWFEVQNRCFYVFTDHPPQWYVLNGCKLFTGYAVDESEYSRFALDRTLLLDFQICCLNFFSTNDTTWWGSQDENTKSWISKNLTLDYALHLNRHPLPSNRDLDVGFNCSIGWDWFDSFWKTNTCSLIATYSHICVEQIT